MKRIVIFILILLAGSARLEAHAFLKDADPGVGSTVQTSPNEVRIRFTENIEPAFSSIQVFDASGKEVDKRDCIWIAPTTRCCTFLCRRSAREPTKSSGAWFLSIHT